MQLVAMLVGFRLNITPQLDKHLVFELIERWEERRDEWQDSEVCYLAGGGGLMPYLSVGRVIWCEVGQLES